MESNTIVSDQEKYNSNRIILTGKLINIEFSHKIKGVAYLKGQLLCKNSNGTESIINVSFKKTPKIDPDHENFVSFVGNIRTRNVHHNKQKTQIYVYTYFDEPEKTVDNSFTLTGNFIKNNPLRTFDNGDRNLQFTLRNIFNAKKVQIESFLPCICWNKLAESLLNLPDNTPIRINGELRSRQYTKYTSDTEYELHIAHELLVTDYEVIHEENI